MTTNKLMFEFKALSPNVGPVTLRHGKKTVTVLRNGVPVKASELKPDQWYEVNKKTGELCDKQ